MYVYIYDSVIIVNYDNYGMTMMLNEKSYHCITLIVIFRDILVWGLHGNPAFLKSYTFIYVYLHLHIYIYQMIRHSLSISATRIGNGWIVLHHGKMDQLKGNALVTGTKCPLQSGWCGGSKHFANIIQISGVKLQADPLGRAFLSPGSKLQAKVDPSWSGRIQRTGAW